MRIYGDYLGLDVGVRLASTARRARLQEKDAVTVDDQQRSVQEAKGNAHVFGMPMKRRVHTSKVQLWQQRFLRLRNRTVAAREC